MSEQQTTPNPIPPASDPVSTVANSAANIIEDIDDLSHEDHPLIWMWNEWRITRFCINKCLKNPGISPDDLVSAVCAGIQYKPELKAYILSMVKGRLAFLKTKNK